jgi:hypothetical protein
MTGRCPQERRRAKSHWPQAQRNSQLTSLPR